MLCVCVGGSYSVEQVPEQKGVRAGTTGALHPYIMYLPDNAKISPSKYFPPHLKSAGRRYCYGSIRVSGHNS